MICEMGAGKLGSVDSDSSLDSVRDANSIALREIIDFNSEIGWKFCWII